MTRLWLLLAGLAVLLLSILLWLPQAGAVDEIDLKNLVLSPACNSPCFMGIQPGVTTFNEAHVLLEKHPWVLEMELIFNASIGPVKSRNGRLLWRWNGQQPLLLRTPFLNAGEIEIEDGVVQSIKAATSVPFGEAWLLLGAPQRGFIGTSRTYLERFYNHQAVYIEQGLRIRTFLPNPLHIDTFWNATVEITFEAAPNEQNHYRLPCWLRCE